MTRNIFMKQLMIFFCILTIGLVGVFGCGELTKEDNLSGKSSDEATINSLMNNEYADIFLEYREVFYNDDYTGSSLSLSSALQGPLIVPAWYRGNIEEEANTTITITGNPELKTATVKLNPSIDATFYVDVDGDWDYGEKVIADYALRTAIFENEAGSGWELKFISPIKFWMSKDSPIEQTVEIIKVEAYVDDELRWYVDDPEHLYKLDEDIPTFSPGEEVVVKVYIENHNDDGSHRETLCYLHPGNYYRVRHLMYDDGKTEGDEVADDEIFTGTFEVIDTTGILHTGIDCIDGEAFKDESTDNYNSAGLGIMRLVF